uniref:Uncharacterized protein n=1 Tax=Anguilla anguilla TaxID=7936 RepID=A0A0E9TVP1_ANGAN
MLLVHTWCVTVTLKSNLHITLP